MALGLLGSLPQREQQSPQCVQGIPTGWRRAWSEQVPLCHSRCFLKIRFTERASIDECFIDFTQPVREELLKRYPHLAQAPSSGTDTALPPPSAPIIWNANTSLVPISPKDDGTDNTGEPNTSVHDDAEVEGPPITWHDIALSIGAEMMQRARDQVRAKLGYSTSAVRVSLPRGSFAPTPVHHSS